jgi:hypothetical protein
MFFPTNAETSMEFGNIPIPGTSYLKYQNTMLKQAKTPGNDLITGKWASLRQTSESLEPAGERRPKFLE